MALYRFYWLDTNDHIRAAENIECESDEGARTVAVECQGEFAAVEVWLDRHRVHRVGTAEQAAG